MKKLLFFALLAIALYSVSVSAAASVANLDNIALGSTNLGATVTKQFTLTNDGTVNLSGAQFTFIGSVSPSFNKTNFNLSTGNSEVITLNFTIPDTFSTGNVTLGSVNLNSTQLNETLFSISAEISKGLLIEDLDVFLTTRPKRSSGGLIETDSASDLDVTDGKKLDFDEEDAGPGSELRFNFNIENTFSENDDVDIEDITITLTIDGIDDGDDIDEESAEFDVDSGKNTDVDIYINIPMSVDEGTYDILVEVEGEDTNGNVHTEEMELELVIKKEPRDVIIASASVFPVKVICGGTATLTATIKNLGNRIEENAQLEILNSDLGVSFIQKDIELEESPFDGDDEFTKNLPIVVGTGVSAGSYPIKINSYIQEGSLWDERTVNLEVEACAGQAVEEETAEEETEQETTETEETEAAPETEEEITGVAVPVLKPETSTEIPLTKRAGFWFAFALVNILVIGSLIYVAVKFYGKKPQ